MKTLIRFLTFISMTIIALGQAFADGHGGKEIETLIKHAVMPLPPSLQADATVVFVNTSGEKKFLRKGSNNMMCRADDPTPGFSVICYHESLDSYWSLASSDAAEDSPEGKRSFLLKAVREGRVNPTRGGILYLLRGAAIHNALPMSVVFIPNLNSKTTGLANVPNPHQPWLMWEGTAISHIMIPGS
ncbi:hypothetical protein OAL10_09630 [Gammaproteobacteria bacterium]|nr:hypothetical protein [Gammaproteobacteria bacterium]